MIGETRNNMDPEESKAKVAVRDALVVFLMVVVSNLLTAGYPPSLEILYNSGLAGLFMGILSYMHARGIKKPEVSGQGTSQGSSQLK